MSAKWMRVETDFVDHPKTFRLAALLQEPLAEAYVLRAWTFLSRFCPTGHVRDIDGTALEAACRWRGQPGALLEALVKCEWLEASKDGGWEAHDWSDHQGKVAQRAAKERERKRAYRERKAAEASASVPHMSHGTSAGHPAQRDVTGRDVTGRDVEKKKEPPSPKPVERGPLVYHPPDTPPAAWDAKDFFRWFQSCRQTAGFVGEKWPRLNLSHWWAEVLATPGMSVERLCDGVRAFGQRQHWRERGLPFGAFAASWREFVPAARGAA